MRIGITDSGVGGLSVCAEVEALLRRRPVAGDIELVYLNAALRDDYSYNAMTSREQKLETFGHFLENVSSLYRPDYLYIACNSLSVLFRDPYFEGHTQVPTDGIVETGTAAMQAVLERDQAASVIVFATPTTVEEGTYTKNLAEAGIDPGRVVQQACPGLPDAISNDYSGRQAMTLLQEFVPAALAQFDRPPMAVAAFLGCTHYGYQAQVFEKLLRKQVGRSSVLNPKQAAAAEILQQVTYAPGNGALEVTFVTPYAIPDKPLQSLPRYLGDRSPATVHALQHFVHDPDLYRLQ